MQQFMIHSGRNWWGLARGLGTILSVLATMLGCGCEQTGLKGTLLGSRFSPTGTAVPQNSEVVAAAQVRPAYETAIDEVCFVICVDDEGIVVCQSTQDPGFHTPEGVAVGMPISQVLALSKAGLTQELGWSYYVPLPSGWNAGFIVDEDHVETPLPQESRVRWLFVRQRASRPRLKALDVANYPVGRDPKTEEGVAGQGQTQDGPRTSIIGVLTCDDGKTAIIAYKNGDIRFDTDSHGFTFADGEYWINNSEVDMLLKGDRYKKRGAGDKARQGDVVVYRNAEGDVEHSATVQNVDEKTGKVWVKDKPGLRKARDSVPADGAWPGAAKIEYYFKEPPASAPQGGKVD